MQASTVEEVAALYAAKDALWSEKFFDQLTLIREESRDALQSLNQQIEQGHFVTDCKVNETFKSFSFQDLINLHSDYVHGTNYTDFTLADYLWSQRTSNLAIWVPTLLAKLADQQAAAFLIRKYDLKLSYLELVS